MRRHDPKKFFWVVGCMIKWQRNVSDEFRKSTECMNVVIRKRKCQPLFLIVIFGIFLILTNYILISKSSVTEMKISYLRILMSTQKKLNDIF